MHALKVTFILSFVLMTTHPLAGQIGKNPEPNRALGHLRDAIRAAGGEANLRAIRTVRFDAVGHRNLLEQSERPEGPYIVEYDRISEVRDFLTPALRRTVTGKIATQPEYTLTTTVSGHAAASTVAGHSSPGFPGDVQIADEELALGPERVLVTALDAPDLADGRDTIIQSVPHHTITFSWHHLPVTLYLNKQTGLPTEVEYVGAYPYGGFWSTWGDVTTRIFYSFWWIARGGIRYPLQWDRDRNGLPDQIWTIDRLEINPDSVVAPALSDSDRAAYLRAAKPIEERVESGRDMRPLSSVELSPGIIHIPGPWNATIVRQDDGIVVLEAPISSAYSARVLRAADSIFPGVPVTAVVTTSDAWPHFSGIREYVARGIPVYHVDLNRPILQRFIASPRTYYPDSLARSPRRADLRSVSEKTLLGRGNNQMEMYPLRGETTERQMMVYFPDLRILYGSDAFQKISDSTYFMPQTVDEVIHAVRREHLRVDKFYMMHMDLTSWSELQAAVDRAKEGR